MSKGIKANVLDFRVLIYNGGQLAVESRTRYNFWELLGDVGGFYDGLILCCSIFMSVYSAMAFKVDVLNNKVVDDSN